MKPFCIFIPVWLIFFFSFLAPCFAQYATLGAGSCGLGQNNCHTRENEWWSADPHFITNERFYDSSKSGEIAKAYGLTLDAARLGTSKCMTCHGTVVMTAREQEPETGVSCESCHGPGSGYKENHSSEKGKGYEIGVRFGMLRNKEMPVRAQMCVSCHLISDVKLLAAGHPNGNNFKYDTGLQKVAKHFRTPDTPQERTAFLAAVLRVKGNPASAVPILAENISPTPVAPKPTPPKRVRAEERLLVPNSPIAATPKISDSSAIETELPRTKTAIITDEAPAPVTETLPAPLPIPPPVFVAPPLPFGPTVKLHRKLELPPVLNFSNARTRADSIAVLNEYLNALLRGVNAGSKR